MSVVIPCYNEAENIKQLLIRAETLLSRRDDIKIIFVENGSTDASASIFAKLISKNDRNFSVVYIPQNMGYGFGIMEGLKQAKTELVAWTHADQQTDILDLIKALELSTRKLGEPTVVKGHRVKRGCVDSFFTRGMSILAKTLLQGDYEDINGQPKLFPKKLIKKILNLPAGKHP